MGAETWDGTFDGKDEVTEDDVEDVANDDCDEAGPEVLEVWDNILLACDENENLNSSKLQ